MIGIYKITSPSGKVYIGQSINIEKRLNQYKTNLPKRQTKLLRSFKKHGTNSHLFEIVATCIKEDLNKLERHYQDLFNCTSINGLNCRLTKSDDKSGQLSAITKNKISLAHIGKIKTKEHSEKIRLKNIGRTPHNKGKKTPTHIVKKLSDSHLGLKLSEKTKLKMSLNSAFSKVVLDTSSGVFYNSAKEVSKLYNIKHNTLICKLIGKNKNNTNFIYA